MNTEEADKGMDLRVKNILDQIVAEVWKQDKRRTETIKQTNNLAKDSGFRIDWGNYRVYPIDKKGGQNGSR